MIGRLSVLRLTHTVQYSCVFSSILRGLLLCSMLGGRFRQELLEVFQQIRRFSEQSSHLSINILYRLRLSLISL